MLPSTANGTMRDPETGMLFVPLDLSDQKYETLTEIASMINETPEMFVRKAIIERLQWIQFLTKEKKG